MLFLVRGKINSYAFLSSGLNQPITRVRLAQIFAMIIFEISMTTPSKLMAHLYYAWELEIWIEGRDYSILFPRIGSLKLVEIGRLLFSNGIL